MDKFINNSDIICDCGALKDDCEECNSKLGKEE